ncbi:RNA recognition motif-containing protein [Lophium mytilinum]|uniref:RNA recognition motif-containing protein n=1 Tax=Lophium mytilinum TaxID=390894 RepID=A0A6A6QU38_9PEZI|nr:RNA recognition motif-containing protein [Lophium mytilinum]
MSSRKVLVDNLNPHTKKDTLYDEFGNCGNVRDIMLSTGGYAYITMSSNEEAERAVKGYNETELEGNKIKVSLST